SLQLVQHSFDHDSKAARRLDDLTGGIRGPPIGGIWPCYPAFPLVVLLHRSCEDGVNDGPRPPMARAAGPPPTTTATIQSLGGVSRRDLCRLGAGARRRWMLLPSR